MQKTMRKLTSCLVAAAVMMGTVLAPGNTYTSTTSQAAYAYDRVSVHDPSIAVSKEGTYYVFGSHIDAAKSTNLMDWKTFTNGYTDSGNKIFGNLSTNLAKPFQWAGKQDSDARGFSVWAPDVFWNPAYVNKDGTKGAYMIYFCTTSTAVRSVIAYGVSQNIEGPYTFVDTLIYSGFTRESAKDLNSKIDKKYTNTNIDELIADGTLKDGINEKWFSGNTGYDSSYSPNAIDPTVFKDKDYDTNGKLWMTYGSWSGGIFVVGIDPATGKVIYPGKNGKTADGRDIDEYFGTRISGGATNSGEGPYILYDKESDYYYLYVSYEGLARDQGYNMRLFRSKNPEGPYLDAAGKNAVLTSRTDHTGIGIKVMGNYTLPNLVNGYMACGHNSAFIDEKSGQRYLIYHARFEGRNEVHQVRVHQQFLNEDGWPVTAPYENGGDVISAKGYDKGDIIGEYAFINHGTQTDYANVLKTSSIVLRANGTVTGAVTGTWTAKDGTYHMSITSGGVTYKGVFFRQTSEMSTAKVMTFSAIGSNNKTIWGVKKGISMSASKSTIYAGGNKDNTSQLTISGIAETGATVSYKSSKTSIASVNSKGKVTAKKKGAATITATIKIGNTTKTLTRKITVKKAYLKFSKKKTSLRVKKSYTYKVKGYGIKTSSVRYKSSKPSVLAVKAKTGKATAKKKGTAKITASYKKAKISVKVKVK